MRHDGEFEASLTGYTLSPKENLENKRMSMKHRPIAEPTGLQKTAPTLWDTQSTGQYQWVTDKINIFVPESRGGKICLIGENKELTGW